MNKILRALHDDIEDQGLKPGTPEYERALVAHKVTRCKEMHGVGSCSDCKAFEHCDLVHEFMMDQRFPNRRRDQK